MKRLYNFSAGPSMLPQKVLETAAAELVCYKNTGQSVMEMSHRSKEYEEIIFSCEALYREILGVPENYKILFLQGGASSQFAMAPMNLFRKSMKADFVITGQWAKKAYSEAKKYGECNVVASSEDKTFCYIPEIKSFDTDADFLHICQNNTIYGTRFSELPDTSSVPLVSDMSSCIASEPVDISKFGMIYAGAQKNLGPAGVTIVIIREDIIGYAGKSVPTMFDYKIHADNDSLYNTPPTYSIYMCKLVMEWIKNDIGGLVKMKEQNERKAGKLYDFLDGSAMFKATVEGKDRSLMNIPFVTGVEELDKKFIKEAGAEGFLNLKGHRSVGGMRASIYNAMPEAGVDALVSFMREFEQKEKNNV